MMMKRCIYKSGRRRCLLRAGHKIACRFTPSRKSRKHSDAGKVLDIPIVDPVNHPHHYAFGKIEVIDAIEDWQLNFHCGQVVKYVVRAGRKDPAKLIEDLEKAAFYLKREIERLKKRNG